MLNQNPVTAITARSRVNRSVVNDECRANDVMLSGSHSYKGQWNNLALGNLDFKHVPSQLISSNTKHSPRVGDVCVRLLPIISRSEEYLSIVDLYNTYIVKGSSLMAKRCISSYTGMEELYIPAIPIHTFVSEWNKSLHQFHDMIRCDGFDSHHTQSQRRMTVVSNVTEIALKHVPILSDHLWFVLHCIVSKPYLVKQVLQLVGSISSTSGTMYHTGEVENTTVPGDSAVHAVKLYLIAKSVPATGNNVTILGDEAGVTLGLIWAADEEELHDHLRSSQNCYYVHVGTESGHTFRCAGFCEWRYYNHSVFNRMTVIGKETVFKFGSTQLAGNTGDSARVVYKA